MTRRDRDLLLSDAIAHARDAASRHRCPYLVWLRERRLKPIQGLDRRGQESSLHQIDLTVFVRPAPAAPQHAPGRVRNNPKDAYVYARITPAGELEIVTEEE
jgi:hypothetical protein